MKDTSLKFYFAVTTDSEALTLVVVRKLSGREFMILLASGGALTMAGTLETVPQHWKITNSAKFSLVRKSLLLSMCTCAAASSGIHSLTFPCAIRFPTFSRQC